MAKTPSMSQMALVVHLSSDVGKPCEECGAFLGAPADDVAQQINHYLRHGFILLHVGTETTHDQDGRPWHTTAAVVGHA